MADAGEPLVQESRAAIVSGAGASLPSFRSALFLLPRADAARPPSLPSQPRDPGPVLGADLRAEFRGWAGSPRLWRRWVAKLRPRHEPLWREVGILGAVLATTSRVRRDEVALLQLAAFWSAGTNTFIFPWGEATVTLEDVAALAGLPLLGCPVRAPLPYELEREVAALLVVRNVLNRSTKKKPSYGAWVKHFLDRAPEKDGGELVEHGAFLAMWLSLFVFAAPPFNVVRREVLPIAVRLARGQSVALAPAALASIYNDLSALKRHCGSGKEREPFGVSAPMHILQLWVWERFPELRPEMAGSPDPGDGDAPWAARWHDVSKRLMPKHVRAVFMSPKEFEWRPYGSSTFALRLETNGCWVHGQDIARSKALLSFARCLHACELVGMNCIEKYRPHRVARQLGFDQDVPGTVARVISKWKKAWDTYNIEAESYSFIFPNHKPGVTVEYVRWWEPYSSACASAVANAAKMKRLHISVTPIKRKMEGLPAPNSCEKLLVDTTTRMPLPAFDPAEDPLDDIPLVERLNSIINIKRHKTECLVKRAEQERSAESQKCSTPRYANVGAMRAVLHRNVGQVLSDEAASYASIVDESSCERITTKVHSKCLQQNKEEVIANWKKDSSSDYDDVLLHNATQGAVSSGSNEATGATAEVDMLPTLGDFLVISDDKSGEANSEEHQVSEIHLKSSMLETKTSSTREGNRETQQAGANNGADSQVLREMMVVVISDDDSDEATSKKDVTFEDETNNEDLMGAMHLKLPKMETTSILEEPNKGRQRASERNDEQDSPMLKDLMVQSNCDCEPATILNNTTLRQEPDSTVQNDVGCLERSTEEMQRCFVGVIDNRDKVHKNDSVEANRNRSGNSERFSNMLVDGITEPDNSVICTTTLYYLSPFYLVKKAEDKYISSTDDQNVYLPQRAVGTAEMIKKASAVRQAEIAELKRTIYNLKEEILVLEAAERPGHLET